MRASCITTILIALGTIAYSAAAEPTPFDTSRGDRMIADYFRTATARISQSCLADIHTLEDWTSRREMYRAQLFEMLSLDPLPQRSDLHATITGKLEHDDFTVELLHFQSRPELYVTGNLYLPRGATKPAPAVLYVCGHSEVKKDGVSLGNKTAYQHHAAWFARHGYVCLVIDSLQLGEIQGIHHGTYREKMWWWNCRGYTPAGVEAWNCIRAVDYLQSRPEVDGRRIGVTGRSGGGAYSWWLAALDDRIAAAVPVAGITDLENHVVDGTVEGHCDCMFMLNTYQWDYALVAALVAPRPLLIANSDKDSIFPLEGVQRIHEKVRKIYQLYGAGDKLGLQISEGPHRDTQELQVAAFRWFNRFLKEDDFTIERAATNVFEPEKLRVFRELPGDQINTRIHETFVPQAAPAAVPASESEWQTQRAAWMTFLKDKCFRAWPAKPEPLDLKPAFSANRGSITLTAIDFTSQNSIRLRFYLLRQRALGRSEAITLSVLDQSGWNDWLAALRPAFPDELKDEVPSVEPTGSAPSLESIIGKRSDIAFVAPRGVGPTAWDQSERKQTQHRRRFMLLGQTLEGMQVWDVRRAIAAARSLANANLPLTLEGEREMGAIALYAALFEPDITHIDLLQPPRTHRDGPNFLNIQRAFDLPQAVAMAAERIPVRIHQPEREGWSYPSAVAKQLGWKAGQFELITTSQGN